MLFNSRCSKYYNFKHTSFFFQSYEGYILYSFLGTSMRQHTTGWWGCGFFNVFQVFCCKHEFQILFYKSVNIIISRFNFLFYFSKIFSKNSSLVCDGFRKKRGYFHFEWMSLDNIHWARAALGQAWEPLKEEVWLPQTERLHGRAPELAGGFSLPAAAPCVVWAPPRPWTEIWPTQK